MSRLHPRVQLLGIATALLVFVVVQVALAGGSDSGPRATSASLKGQIKKLKRRVAALEAKPDQVGQTPTIPTTLPPSGPAGGELRGTYPSPLIGQVAGLDLASSTSPTGGINFVPDASLFRSAANTLRTDDSLDINNAVDVQEHLNVGNGLTTAVTRIPETTGVLVHFPDSVFLFARDNGSGKTQLRVQFPTGAEQVLATEP